MSEEQTRPPKRSIYVRPDGQEWWDRAAEFAGKQGMSALIEELLKRYVTEMVGWKEDAFTFERIQVEIRKDEANTNHCQYKGNRLGIKAFFGHILLENWEGGPNSNRVGAPNFYSVAITPKHNIAIWSTYNTCLENIKVDNQGVRLVDDFDHYPSLEEAQKDTVEGFPERRRWASAPEEAYEAMREWFRPTEDLDI